MNLRRSMLPKVKPKPYDLNYKLLEQRNIGVPVGWGNGYVDLPRSHYFYGTHYEGINNFVEVHGGLTFSEERDGVWRVGFDTAHFGDTLSRWPKERVENETINLKNQLIALKDGATWEN